MSLMRTAETSSRFPSSSPPRARASETTDCTGPHAAPVKWRPDIKFQLNLPATDSSRQPQRLDTSALKLRARSTVASRIAASDTREDHAGKRHNLAAYRRPQREERAMRDPFR